MKINYILISIVVILIGLVGFFAYKANDAKITSQSMIRDRDGIPNEVGMGPEEGIGPRRGEGPIMESKRTCLAEGCLAVEELTYPVEELPEGAIESLNRALDDEYKAQATYEAIIAELGKVRPFIMIIRAEEQHISSLKALFDKYGLDIPENPYTGNVTSPTTLSDACNEGVTAEMENASLYKEELLPSIEDYEDITAVFVSLMNASEQKHLPAFQRCAL